MDRYLIMAEWAECVITKDNTIYNNDEINEYEKLH